MISSSPRTLPQLRSAIVHFLAISKGAAEDIFFQNPKDFYSLEKSVKSTTEAFSAAFLGNVLTSMNEKIYEDGWRKTRYTAQRTDKRMLISSVGDITFESTYFRRKADGVHHYLLEEILELSVIVEK